ncbi:hypothetical protein ACFV0Z_14970 [Streptomyces xiamenensis]|uniref:hypothetical protein n=1 Tax=Streptomyces xiamenensis TaxID=408015 RepID=UPI00369726F5
MVGARVSEVETADEKFFGGVADRDGRLTLLMPSEGSMGERDSVVRMLLAKLFRVSVDMPRGFELSEVPA